MLYKVQTQIMFFTVLCLALPCLRQMEKCLLAYTINALVKKRKNDEYICVKIQSLSSKLIRVENDVVKLGLPCGLNKFAFCSPEMYLDPIFCTWDQTFMAVWSLVRVSQLEEWQLQYNCESIEQSPHPVARHRSANVSAICSFCCIIRLEIYF